MWCVWHAVIADVQNNRRRRRRRSPGINVFVIIFSTPRLNNWERKTVVRYIARTCRCVAGRLQAQFERAESRRRFADEPGEEVVGPSVFAASRRFQMSRLGKQNVLLFFFRFC